MYGFIRLLRRPPADKSRLVDLGADLRRCGRALSLKALESKAFMEELFESAFWGLHHLDRLGVSFPPLPLPPSLPLQHAAELNDRV